MFLFLLGWIIGVMTGLVEKINGKLKGEWEMKLNKNELLQIYEWFYYIRDTNFAHLSDEDRKLATKIRKEAMKQSGLKDK